MFERRGRDVKASCAGKRNGVDTLAPHTRGEAMEKCRGQMARREFDRRRAGEPTA